MHGFYDILEIIRYWRIWNFTGHVFLGSYIHEKFCDIPISILVTPEKSFFRSITIILKNYNNFEYKIATCFQKAQICPKISQIISRTNHLRKFLQLYPLMKFSSIVPPPPEPNEMPRYLDMKVVNVKIILITSWFWWKL